MGSLGFVDGGGSWASSGSVELPGGSTATASGSLTYDADGELTDAHVDVQRVLMPGLFELTDFALDYVTTDQGATWTGGGQVDGERSEEHTSELQSLMRISYAVFCLKKKKYNNAQTIKKNIRLDKET